MKKTLSKKETEKHALSIPSKIRLEHDELPILAAGLVHETKNPLASIHLHLQLLEGYLYEVENPELRQKLHNKVNFIKQEISGLDKSLHNFLKLIRKEQQSRSHPIDLNIILEGVVELLKPQANNLNVDLEFQGGELELLETGEEGFIKQIAINLILNAIQSFSIEDTDHSKKDTKKFKSVIVKTGSRQNHIYMMIIDNGPGISQENLKKIFEPYYSTKKSSGSGIGLTLVKKMVSEMQAHLEIQSKVGEGTRIAVLFSNKKQIMQS